MGLTVCYTDLYELNMIKWWFGVGLMPIFANVLPTSKKWIFFNSGPNDTKIIYMLH